MSDSLYYEIADQQRRQFIDGEQVRTAWLSAERRVVNYRGSMYWQQSKGHAYLYPETSKDQRKSVGPRTPETEKIHAEFKSGKAAAEQRFRSLSQSLATHERPNAALRVGRTPNLVISLLEEIRKAGLQDHLLVTGTNVLFAYESHVGVRFNGGCDDNRRYGFVMGFAQENHLVRRWRRCLSQGRIDRLAPENRLDF